MRFVTIPLIVLVSFIILWIDLPENFPFVKPYFKTRLGLDLKGGSHLVFQADAAKVKKEDLSDALNATRDIIEKRVNFFGVSEPSVQIRKSGATYRIVVELPGISNVSDAVSRIGKTAQLTFREEEAEKAKTTTESALLINFKPQASLTGKDVKKATVQFDQQTGKPQVALRFSENGVKLFADMTKRNVKKRIGIFLDQFFISGPVVQQPILDGNAVIVGDFSLDEAKQLAQDINAGALPLPISLVEQRSIGPTLGASEVQKSLFGGTVGLLAVMLFMILYYTRLGIVACCGLVIYGLISLAIFRAVPVVLTLSGVAGFLLSIGMAVDSNILIFERIKEEQRQGRDFENAVRVGFGRAIDAIKDANFTTLIVSFILFNPLNWDFLPQFGLVRGFALTLMIGVATSLFTGVVITKRLINIFYRKQ